MNLTQDRIARPSWHLDTDGNEFDWSRPSFFLLSLFVSVRGFLPFLFFFTGGIKYWPLASASRKLVTDFACLENQSLSMLPVNSGGYVNVISLSLRFIDPKIAFFYSRTKSKSLYLKRIPQNCR